MGKRSWDVACDASILLAFHRGTKEGSKRFQNGYPAIYGVLENRYLVPVASPVRVKGVKDIDAILELAPPDDLWLFGTWESLLGVLIFEAMRKDRVNVTERWPLLVGGAILEQSAAWYMRGGTLSAEEQASILRALNGPPRKPELAENLLLRICGCVERGRLSPDDVRALFRCRHFRINVTEHDAEQMIQAYRLLKDNSMGSDDALGLMGGILNLLKDQPADSFEEPQLFEMRTQQPDAARFTLLLQEFGAAPHPVLTLTPS